MHINKLAKRLKKGDEAALAEIIKEFSPIAAAIIYNLSGGNLQKPDIEEVLADTFIALWYNREKIIDDRLPGFICCIAKNKARDKLKTIGKNQTVCLDDIEITDDLSVSEEVENNTIYEILGQALDSIEEPDKEIILRHYFYYQTSTQISEIMNINLHTVRSKIQRTREKLKKFLTERGVSQ